MKKIIVILLMVFTAKINGYGQAFRMNYLGIANPLHTGTEASTLPLSIGLGYEQNIGYRLAVTLEYNISYDNFINPKVIFGDPSEKYPHQGTVYTSQSSSYGFDYDLTYPMSEIGYQSKYFFLDNDDHSAYFSTGLSLLTIKYTWKIKGNDYGTRPNNLRDGSYRETITTVPLSFRFGYRGPISGFFGDYSFGFKYNLSGDKNPTEKTYHYVNSESKLRDLSFVMNLSWGFGWAKRPKKQL